MAKKGQASKAIVYGIVALLFVGLVGLGTRNFGGRVQSIGRVGDREIAIDDYARELQSELRALSAQTGQSLSMEEAAALGVDRQVLNRLIGRAALDDTTETMGLSVGDAAVRDEITRIEAFQGVDGAFDREAYAFALRNVGLNVAQFEERVRDEAARNLVQRAVTAGFVAPDPYVNTLYAWAREQRDISWALLGPGDLKTPIAEPTEAELQAFHDAHPELFTQPETKAVTYAWLTPDMMLDKIEVSEEELRARYDERADEFNQPERRLVERLAFRSEEDAAAARARLDAGEVTFDTLVEERGLTLADVDLGDVSKPELDQAGEAVFALEGPGVVGPLPSSFGPALFRVNAILAATQTPFEDVQDELRAELAADRAKRAIDDRRDQIDDLLAGGATLEELGAETDMETGSIDYRAGVESGIAAYEDFRAAVDETAEGDFPELRSFAQGGLFALRVDKVTPPELQPLDAVRDAVAEAWTAAATRDALLAEAEADAQALRDGADPATLGLSLREANDLTRDGFVEGAPEGFLDAVFAMAPEEVRALPAADGAAVVRLDAVSPPADDAEAAQLKEAFAQRTAQELSGDALQLYLKAVQGKVGIELNQQAIAAVQSRLN